MSDYSQTRSFNVGIAEDTSIEAAMIYDDLVYAQKVFGEGYFFRSDHQMLKRFPFFSKNTLRRHVAKLASAGYISTKVMQVNGKPTLNYQVEQFLNTQNGQNHGNTQNGQNQIPKMGKTYNIETTSIVINKGEEKELIALVNEITHRNFRTVGVKSGIKKTLDLFSLVEIKKALTALAADPWHAPRLKELSIDYLIRSTTIDKFLQIANTQNTQASAPRDGFPRKDANGDFWYDGEKIDQYNTERIEKKIQADRAKRVVDDGPQ